MKIKILNDIIELKTLFTLHGIYIPEKSFLD
jgi:hypothetical protein